MRSDLTTAPTQFQRALGVTLSLVAIVALAALGGIILYGQALSGNPNPMALLWISSGVLFLMLLSAWLFYRFAFTRPQKLGKTGLYIVSALALASAAGHVALGYVTDWQSLRPAAIALALAITAIVLARSGRDA